MNFKTEGVIKATLKKYKRHNIKIQQIKDRGDKDHYSITGNYKKVEGYKFFFHIPGFLAVIVFKRKEGVENRNNQY